LRVFIFLNRFLFKGIFFIKYFIKARKYIIYHLKITYKEKRNFIFLNTEVKTSRADGTLWVTARESKSLRVFIFLNRFLFKGIFFIKYFIKARKYIIYHLKITYKEKKFIILNTKDKTSRADGTLYVTTWGDYF
jgi:hypothetical protein